MAVVSILRQLMKDETLGKYIVPIVPDEARTFGMDGLFKVNGIYSPQGQNYTPVDAENLLSSGISIFAGPGWTRYTPESRSAHENRFHRTIVQVLRPSLSPR